MKGRTALTMAAIMLGFACTQTDYGQPCPQLLNGTDPTQPTGDPTTTDTQEVVEQNPKFPCEQLICVASGGTAGYCSGKCLDDVGCPAGFECRVLQEVGPFAGAQFCAWKACDTAQDCGSTKDFCCASISAANPNQEYRLCQYANHGKCP